MIFTTRQEFLNQIWKRVLKTDEEVKALGVEFEKAGLEADKLINLKLQDQLVEFDRTTGKRLMNKINFVHQKKYQNFILLLSNIPDEIIKNN